MSITVQLARSVIPVNLFTWSQ